MGAQELPEGLARQHQQAAIAQRDHVGDARLSVSLVTIELEPVGAGTRLRFTEQGAFLDGHQAPAEREHGTRVGMERLEAMLAAESQDALARA